MRVESMYGSPNRKPDDSQAQERDGLNDVVEDNTDVLPDSSLMKLNQ